MSHPNNDPALVRSTSDVEQVTRAREIEGRQKDREDGWLLAMLGTYAGRAVLKWSLTRCGEDQDCFTPQRSSTDYLVGRQSWAIELKRAIKRVSIDGYLLMEREANERKALMRDP